MKKKKLIYWQYPIVIIGGVLLFYFVSRYNRLEMENAPKLDFEHAIDSLYVNKIDFPRGGFYVNGILYNAFGITDNSKISHQNELINLFELPPPFIISKEANNDTLKIIKNNKMYYMLISEEIERRKNK